MPECYCKTCKGVTEKILNKENAASPFQQHAMNKITANTDENRHKNLLRNETMLLFVRLENKWS